MQSTQVDRARSPVEPFDLLGKPGAVPMTGRGVDPERIVLAGRHRERLQWQAMRAGLGLQTGTQRPSITGNVGGRGDTGRRPPSLVRRPLWAAFVCAHATTRLRVTRAFSSSSDQYVAEPIL